MPVIGMLHNRKEVVQMGFFKKLFGKPVDSLYAPISGKAVPITEVPDPTFAEGMLGNGIAIEPVDGKVYATYNIEAGKKITVPSDPEKEGYDFAGWNPEVPVKMPENDIIINKIIRKCNIFIIIHNNHFLLNV